MTIAEKMLELLDEGWGTKVLRRYGADGKMKFRCAVGVRLDATGMTEVYDEIAAMQELKGDPVITTMARIIREQYPEVIASFISAAADSVVMRSVLACDVSLVMLFNDRYARLPDIRSVIEKAIAEGL